MEETKSRLSRLLSKERALRRSTTDVLEETALEDIRERVKENGIDTSPLTSPENMAHTRRRLSRLLEQNKANAENQRHQLFLSQSASNMNRSTEGLGFGASGGGKTTPTRVRKRVTINAREIQAYSPPERRHGDRIYHSQRRLARSLSPPRHATGRHLFDAVSTDAASSGGLGNLGLGAFGGGGRGRDYRDHDRDHGNRDHGNRDHGNRDHGNRDHGNQDLGFDADLRSLHDVDLALSKRVRGIRAADQSHLRAELAAAAAPLSRVGVARVQFWSLGALESLSLGTGAFRGPDEAPVLVSERPDGHAVSLTAHQTHLAQDFSRDASSAFGAGSCAMLPNPAGVHTWFPEHPAFPEMVRAAEAASAESFPDGVGRPVAIHALRVGGGDDAPATLGLVLVVEVSSQTLPFSSFSGLREDSMAKLRRFLVLQMLQKLSAAVESRLSDFRAVGGARGLAAEAEGVRERLREREAELLGGEAVLRSREALLRESGLELQCKDALLTLAALLGAEERGGGQAQARHCAVVATAVARSG
ncbi:hypothetical protein B484DRAFT_430724, partial [Ochromonadaceae sp. CCMP2298]